jgi:hypothetical protein
MRTDADAFSYFASYKIAIILIAIKAINTPAAGKNTEKMTLFPSN